MTWNGKDLQANFTQEAGYSDSKSLDRTLRIMNEVQRDIASGADWANLKFKLEKIVPAGVQQIDISPQVTEKPDIKLLAGGELTVGSACLVKVTFLIFDNEKQEYSSIESEPSEESNLVAPTEGNATIQLTNIPCMEVDPSSMAPEIHRRIYLKQGAGPFKLALTIKDNDETTAIITTNPTSTITPPEQSMVEHLSSEDVTIRAGSFSLDEETVDNIQKHDPGMTATGIPRYYARISETRVLLYPRPSGRVTISYWVKRRPSQIFAEADRPIQLNRSLENVFEVGVSWKWMKYKQDSEWMAMFNLYTELKSAAKAEKVRKGGKAAKVRVVC